MKPIITSSILFLFLSNATHAHVGHLGELAGHTHWVGVGATLVAGALAAWLGTRKGRSEDEEDEQPKDAQGEAT